MFFISKEGVLFFFRKSNASKESELIFKELYLTNAKKAQQKHELQKTALALMIAVSFFVLFAIAALYNPLAEYKEAGIKRPQEGTVEEKVTLWYESENGKEGSIDVILGERRVQGEELNALIGCVKDYIDQNLLLKNPSEDEVSSDLNLMTDIQGINVSISWETDCAKYVTSRGSVRNDELEKALPVSLKATIQYYDQQFLYNKDITVVPQKRSEEETLKQEVEKELRKKNEESQTSEYLNLPMNVEGASIRWYTKKENKVVPLLILVCTAGIALLVSMDQRLKKKRKERSTQMLIDYPEIVCKFNLLLNAGMTIRGAFERIVKDYMQRKELLEKGREKDFRYAYEELGLAIRELELGRPESIVYESYGRRCGLLCYIRFTTMIVQNMKKGTKGIVAMLENEALNAFEERKECAKRLGEEAGTKLLGPMMGMLLIVLMLVLVPAFLNFNL